MTPDHRRGRQVVIWFLNAALSGNLVLLVPYPLPRIMEPIAHQQRISDVFDRGVILAADAKRLRDPLVIQE